MMDICIRYMIRRDMPQVLEIEQLCFTDPWTEEDFILALRQRCCIGMVAVDESGAPWDDVLGFAIYELPKRRIELLNIAVHPSVWRRGIGTAMIAKLSSKLSVQRRQKICLNVADNNVMAHLFFKAQGFSCVKVQPEFYDHRPDLAAYRFEYVTQRELQPA